ncbi:hypothetical protein HQ865_19140 [Mucilaginibacter mali]|uniref:Uncharacterized protein n=1 Tax=Mucilaginibacter mali TaxID=2740462 RepID=A0A7D4QA76_9SPHI|nr:hypothetical protein [Mucilaginibacter mali]QKJ31791.1 hypothetical protein HQ865_19140 [Mucilaginibacter mali]
MKPLIALLTLSVGLITASYAQTLQTVTSSGATTTSTITVGGLNTPAINVARPSAMVDAGNALVGEYIFAPANFGSSNGYLRLSYPNDNTIRFGTDYDGHVTGTNIFKDIQFGRGSSPYLTIKDGGNLGIGTNAPNDLLHIDAGTTRRGITLSGNGDGSAYTDIQLSVTGTGGLANGTPTEWVISHRQDGYFSNATGGSSVEFYGVLKGGGYYAPMSFKPNGDVVLVSGYHALGGKVGIGTTAPDEKLTVYGKIHSQEVKVDLGVPGPDYVFEPSYKLPTLSDIKTFVDKNHHLPEIPTAADMAKNGIDLGEMNTKLLKKVEELTLYLIEKDKKEQQHEKRIKILEKQIKALRKH